MLTGVAECRVSFVSRDDVTAAAAGVLFGDGYEGAIYTATSDQRFTGAERPALIAEIAGRPMAFMPRSEERLRGGLGRAGLPPVVIGIQKAFVADAYDIVSGDVERLTSKPRARLRDLISTDLRPSSAH